MKNARILVVEDDPCASLLVAGWLRHLGSTVIEAASIAEADAALAAGGFDLIVSDVNLPGNHHLQWIERLLQGDFPPPILLLTGNPELETTLRAANLPVAGYLVKPPDFAALGELLQRLIAEHRRRTALRALSHEAARLVDAGSASEGDPHLQQKLHQLSHCLASEAGRSPREAARPNGSEVPWRTAVIETITVLEKTKHSFRSKELGQLRRHLEALLSSSLSTPSQSQA